MIVSIGEPAPGRHDAARPSGTTVQFAFQKARQAVGSASRSSLVDARDCSRVISPASPVLSRAEVVKIVSQSDEFHQIAGWEEAGAPAVGTEIVKLPRGSSPSCQRNTASMIPFSPLAVSGCVLHDIPAAPRT